MDDLKLLKALKNKILSLAMQGKLVKQDENDEPASILLEKIKKEKAELLKQGKLKKEKELPPISADEVPYELPKSWKCVRLGDLVKYDRYAIKRGPFGSSITKSMFVNKSNNTFKIYEQGNAIKKTINYGTYYIQEDDYMNLKSFEVLPDDIIISCAGTMGECFIIPQNAPKGIINQALLKISLNPSVMNNNFFIYLFKILIQEQIEENAVGTAIKNMASVSWLKNDVVFPLPPLAEQERIVAKIEEIFAIIDEIENNITENKKLSKVLYNKLLSLAMQGKLVKQDENDEPASILLEKIKKEKAELLKQGKLKKEKELPPIKEDEVPYELPKSWQWVRLGEVCEIFKRAKSDKINLPLMDVKYLRTKQNPQIYTSGIVVYKDELIILVDGENSGEVFTVFEQGVLGSTLNILDINQNISKKYILFILFYFKDMFRKSKKGAAIPHLDKNLFKNLLIPLPPLEEQKRIVAKIEEIKEIIDDMG